MIMKSKRVMKIRHRIEYIVLYVIMVLLQHTTLKSAIRAAERLGDFVFFVLKTRRKVVYDNLTLAFPEKSEEEKFKIARRAYRNFAMMIFEYCRFPVLTREDVLSLVSIEGGEKIEEALEHGRGAVMVAGHFGNWELMGAALSLKGYPICFLVGEQHNKLVDNRMNEFREMMGIKIIHRGVAVRGVLKALRENMFVALLSDQDAGKDGVFVNFFGKLSSTHQGAAVFALKTKSPIITGVPIRYDGYKHHVVCGIIKTDQYNGVTDENVKKLTQAYTSFLEEQIRKYPDHWFWMHKRWKSHPVMENESIKRDGEE